MLGRDHPQPWQRNLAPFLRLRLWTFTTLSLHQSQGCWDRLQTVLLPCLQQQGNQPAHAPVASHARITFWCLVCSLQNIKDNFSEVLQRLQGKQSGGQGRPDLGMETRVTAE